MGEGIQVGWDSKYEGFQEVGAMEWVGDRFWKSGCGQEEIPQWSDNSWNGIIGS